jgi:hypothetical protein
MLQQHLDWSEHFKKFNNSNYTVLYSGFKPMHGYVVSLQEIWFASMLSVSLCWVLKVEEGMESNELLYLIPLISFHNS